MITRRSFLPLSLIGVASIAQGRQKYFPPIKDPTIHSDDINIKNYGAVPNDGGDDSTAFLAALDHATTARNSRRIIVPSGEWTINAGVFKNFAGVDEVIIQGAGSGSIIRLATPNTAFDFHNAPSITFRDLTIAGNPNGGAAADVGIGIHLQNVFKASFENCFCYGVLASNGLIKAENTNLHINSSKFYGCAAGSDFGQVALIWARNYIGNVITNNQFVDYGSLESGSYYSKTGRVTYAWIHLDKPLGEIVGTVYPEANMYAQGAVQIEGNYFDEGALWSTLTDGPTSLARLRIAHNNTNSNASAGGHYVRNVRYLDYDQNATVFTAGADVSGLILQSVMDADVNGSFFLQRANRIVVLAGTRLKIKDSNYSYLELAAPTLVRIDQQGKTSIKMRPAGLYTYDQLTPTQAFESDDL